MQTDRQSAYVTIFTLAVLLAGLYIAQRFLISITWAAILATASWRLYRSVTRRFHGLKTLAALITTMIVAAVFITPVLLFVAQASRRAPDAAAFIADANLHGIKAPAFLARLPVSSAWVENWWETTLAQPHGLARMFSDMPAARMSSAGELLKLFGVHVLHALVNFGFSIVCLFFFYLNGQTLRMQIDVIGNRYLGQARWQRYAEILPLAINSTVNGLVLVGVAEGALLGVAYALTGVSSPVLWGGLTAVLAMIPFGAPIVYLGVSALLLATGNVTAAISIAAWGTLVLLVADHFVRPRIIGGATKMPFLLVLFGILGGVETFGLVGLFLGPCIMAFVATIWRESGEDTVST